MKQQKANKKRINRINKIKEYLSLFWNSYQHMYDARHKSVQDQINFLLVITTFLPILSVTLYTTDLFKNLIILTPAVFQIIAILVLLKSFFISGLKIPWFEIKITLDSIENDSFPINALAQIKAAEADTDKHIKEYKKIIKVALCLIIFSLYSLLISVIFIFLNATIYQHLVAILVPTIFFMLIYNYYLTPNKSNFDSEYEKEKKRIEEWVQEGKIES